MTEQPTTLSTVGRSLTWEEYQSLPEDRRAEYIDGHLVVSPSPSRQHQRIALRLVSLFEAVLPETHEVNTAWAWKPGRDEFIPDVLIYDVATASAGTGARFTGIPDLVVEVPSSNRGDDLVWKSAKYAAAGLPRYWIVDPRDELITAYALVDGILTPTATLGRGDVGDLDVGVGTVRVDVEAVLG